MEWGGGGVATYKIFHNFFSTLVCGGCRREPRKECSGGGGGG